MFCNKCGKEVTGNFCTNCGNDVNKTQNQQLNSNNHNEIGGEKVMSKHNGKATTSLVLGIISLIMWLIPLLGFPVSIIGIIMGFYGMKSQKRSIGIIGLVLSIIGLVICVANSAIGAYMGATGQLF